MLAKVKCEQRKNTAKKPKPKFDEKRKRNPFLFFTVSVQELRSISQFTWEFRPAAWFYSQLISASTGSSDITTLSGQKKLGLLMCGRANCPVEGGRGEVVNLCSTLVWNSVQLHSSDRLEEEARLSAKNMDCIWWFLAPRQCCQLAIQRMQCSV